jgi:sirohydrochlorin cobaltochelatase
LLFTGTSLSNKKPHEVQENASQALVLSIFRKTSFFETLTATWETLESSQVSKSASSPHSSNPNYLSHPNRHPELPMTAPEIRSQTDATSPILSQESIMLLQDLTRRSGAVLVVGHGTRNPAGAKQLLELVGHMQARASGIHVTGCFLELAEPTIEQAITFLHSIGVKRILVVPVLLFTAAHAREDIPDAVAPIATALGMEVVGQSISLGTHPSILSLSQVRYREVTALSTGSVCPPGACARVHCASGTCEGASTAMGRIGLAMVGRGTSDLIALEHMRQLTELRIADGATEVVARETGFFAGGTPNVDGLLELASTWECDTVIVQPHLLFEGELIVQLRSKVKQSQASHPDRRWFIARTLGADPQLADVFLQLAATHDS